MRPRTRARLARRRLRRALRRCDAAVTEVLGYILMLFLSSAVLMVSLQAFLQSRETAADIHAGQELKLIVNRVAAEVQQAGFVASEAPNATFEARMQLPALGGRAYYINTTHGKVYANTTDGALTGEAEVSVQSLDRLSIGGTVYGAQGYARVTYERHPASGDRWINVTV